MILNILLIVGIVRGVDVALNPTVRGIIFLTLLLMIAAIALGMSKERLK